MNVRCSIYQMSRCTRPSICQSSFVSPRKPVTCAQPVIPGLTKMTNHIFYLSNGNILLCASTCADGGPTKDISPFSTLINWGSSSTFVLRIRLPIRVLRGSHSVACKAYHIEHSPASNGTYSTKIHDHLHHFVSALKKTGPGELIFIASPTMMYNREKGTKE